MCRCGVYVCIGYKLYNLASQCVKSPDAVNLSLFF